MAEAHRRWGGAAGGIAKATAKLYQAIVILADSKERSVCTSIFF